MTNAFFAVLNASVAACWLIAAVLLLRFVLRKSAPKWVVCLLWGVAALRLVMPFSIQSPFGLVPQGAASVSETAFQANASPAVESGRASNSGGTGAAAAPHTAAPSAPYEAADQTVPAAPVNPEAPAAPSTPANPAVPAVPAADQTVPAAPAAAAPSRGAGFYLAAAWIAGVAAMLAYALVNYLLLRRRMAASVPYMSGVRQSEKVRSPFVLGLFRPTVYLPFGLDPSTESHVLSHERAHIARGDHWLKFLWFAVISVHWFNPLVWLSFVLLCSDIEYACDERVLRDMPHNERQSYAGSLLALGVHSRRIAACPVAFGETNVKNRVKRVFSFKKPAVWLIVIILVASAVLTACFATVRGESEAENFSAPDETSANKVLTEDDYKSYKLGVRVDSIPTGDALKAELDRGVVYYTMHITTGEKAGTTEIYRFEDMYCDPVVERSRHGFRKNVVLFRGNQKLSMPNPLSSYSYGGHCLRHPAQYGLFEDKILSLDFSANNKAPDDLIGTMLIYHTTFKDPQKAFGKYTEDDYESVWYRIATDGTVIRCTYTDGEIIYEYSDKKLEDAVTAYFFALYYIETGIPMVYSYDQASVTSDISPKSTTVKYGGEEYVLNNKTKEELFDIVYLLEIGGIVLDRDGTEYIDKTTKNYYFDYTLSAAPHGDYPTEPLMSFSVERHNDFGVTVWIDVMQDGTLLSESYLGEWEGLHMRTRIVSTHKCDVNKLKTFIEGLPEASAFSWADTESYYKDMEDPGIIRRGFVNTVASAIGSPSEAVRLALNEHKLQHDETYGVYYDKDADVWKVSFSNISPVAGGCVDVYLSGDGVTLLIIAGE